MRKMLIVTVVLSVLAFLNARHVQAAPCLEKRNCDYWTTECTDCGYRCGYERYGYFQSEEIVEGTEYETGGQMRDYVVCYYSRPCIRDGECPYEPDDYICVSDPMASWYPHWTQENTLLYGACPN